MKIDLPFTILVLRIGASFAQDISGCLSNVDPNIDYFPNKVAPFASKSWSIDYFNTYKILTNYAANETYLLYQCGSEIPQSEVDSGRHTAIVQIPVTNVGIGVTTIIPQLEQLGVVDSIIAFTSDPSLISSPCLLENIAEGNVIVLQSRDEYDNYTATPESTEETLMKLQSAVGFTDPFSQSPPFSASVKISEYKELTNAGIFEWIKFFAAFYNLEVKANEVFDVTEDRWDCISEAASIFETSDSPDDTPVVFWMTYSDYCEGWYIGSCPNFYCEFTQQCSATLIQTNITGNYSDACDSYYLSTDDVVELGKDADYWFYLASDWNATYTLFKDKLDTMRPVQEMNVYDFQGSGPGAWFETRSAEYFVVLQDFCTVVGTVSSSLPVNRKYFRNVMDGTPVGSIGTNCTENSRSNSILPVSGSVCVGLNLPTSPILAPVSATVVTPIQAPVTVPATPIQAPAKSPMQTPTSSTLSTPVASTIRYLLGVVIAAMVMIVC
jgi:iron complex transport system substrate-binding protein